MESGLRSDELESHDQRPPVPPKPFRPNSGDISPSITVTSPLDSESPSTRNRGRSGRSWRSWRKKSYEQIEMKQLGTDETYYKITDDEVSPKNVSQPKAFRKNHRFLGLRLGFWRMPIRHFSIFSILFLAVFLPLWFASGGYSSIGAESLMPFEYNCYGDGGWTFVGINIRFGRFDYGAAKALDLAWNWIVGRGLQAVFTFLAYRVFSDALLRAAEMTPISFELFAALGLYSTKPEIVWQLIKGLTRYGNWRIKLIFAWLLISILYLMSFPSLLDACSGYEAAQIANFKWPNGSISNTEGLNFDYSLDGGNVLAQTFYACPVWYTNSTPDAAFNITWLNRTQLYEEYSDALRNQSVYAHGSPGSGRRNQTYLDYINSVDPDTLCEEFYWSAANTSGFVKHHISECSAYSSSFMIYNWTDHELNDTWWGRFRQDPMSSQSDQWSSWGFYPTKQDNYFCTTKTNEYQWGFSYEWLFVVSIVNSVWLVGLWILWLDCDTNSEFCRKGRRLGLWRAVADISEAMREELGPNICAYSEQELAQALKNKPPVKYYSSLGTETDPGHIGLSSRPSGRLRLRWNYEYGKMCQ